MTIILLSILFISSLLYFKKPKHNRDWRPEQSKLPIATIDGDEIFIKNIRNCSYKSENDVELDYYDKKFSLKKIKSIDLIIQPFKKMSFMSHIFLSFGFEGGEYISVSVEARRKNKKSFSIFGGFFRMFEIIYIIADEKDIMRLRPLHHKDNVYIYPLKIKKSKIKNIFLDILKRVNRIEGKSEFYNTLTNSCVTNILDHMKENGVVGIPSSWRFYIPSKIDKLLYKTKLLKTKLPFNSFKENHRINDRAEKYKDDADYSAKIRS
ncbi:MAG: DUF4105 domain-containing protein [Patescibacteria group bacterium]|jgi:hypothetical protein|nr:DUF4105 domain-containing protein [Patescibacteria group bacterium]